MDILILEDDEMALLGLSILVTPKGKVTEYTQAHLLLKNINNISCDLAFIDLDLEEELIGLEVISKLSEKGIYTVALTGREDDEVIAKAYELGAKDYLVKPINEEKIDLIFNNVKIQSAQNINLGIGVSQEQVSQITNAIIANQKILITGETGTGKTYLAKKIHNLICEIKDIQSSKIPFVSINCSEIASELFESEMFGHKKGAFTGALDNKMGRIEQAQNGVLFIDEIGSISLSQQVKLLKVLDEKMFYRVGESVPVKTNAFIICATCEDLTEKIEKGYFRTDFYHRIKDVEIELLPFRRYKDNEKLKLINVILKSLPRRITLTPEALVLVLENRWMGNLRELEKFLTALSLSSQGVITKEVIESKLIDSSQNILSDDFIEAVFVKAQERGLTKIIEEIEREVIKRSFQRNQFKSRKTIESLKISNNMFYKYIEKNQEK